MLSNPPDPTPTVLINGVEVPQLWYQGQPVVTFRQIDEFHQRPSGTARKRFSDNRRHLIEGEDFFRLGVSEIRTPSMQSQFPPGMTNCTVLTQSGYLMVTKSFTDDLAWRVHREMVRYFRSGSPSSTEWTNDLARVDAAVSVITDPMLAFQALQRMAGELDLARTQLVELEPKAAFYDAVNGSFGSMTVKDAAQACGMGERRLFAWLKAHGYLQQGNRPYQRWIDRGYFEVRLRTFNIGGNTFTSTQPLITGKGLIRIQRELGCGQSIRLELDGNPGGVA